MDNNEIKEEFRRALSKDDFLNYIDSKEIDLSDVITLLFLSYITRKDNGTLYSASDYLPQNLIKIYYSNVTVPRFKKIFSNFKEEYIVNECTLENVHEVEECEGLGLVYDYIETKDDYENIDIYQLLKIHQILFSKCPYPEFGGNFRTDERYLPNSGIETCDWRSLPNEVAKLYMSSKELIKEGVKLGKRRNSAKIIGYINDCLDLNAKIIEMHPFGDGNGRATRAFTNLMFKIANIPPVYIKEKEKEAYGKAMNKAIVEKDPQELRKFYYYKICDSIVELDIMKKNYASSRNESIEKGRTI